MNNALRRFLFVMSQTFLDKQLGIVASYTRDVIDNSIENRDVETDLTILRNETEEFLKAVNAIIALRADYVDTIMHANLNDKEKDLITKGLRVKAIQSVRERYGFTIREAKDLVDSYQV